MVTCLAACERHFEERMRRRRGTGGQPGSGTDAVGAASRRRRGALGPGRCLGRPALEPYPRARVPTVATIERPAEVRARRPQENHDEEPGSSPQGRARQRDRRDRPAVRAGRHEATPWTAGRTTILKDNISWHFPFPGANTTPWQLEGTILALRARGLRGPGLRAEQDRGHRRLQGRGPEQLRARSSSATTSRCSTTSRTTT